MRQLEKHIVKCRNCPNTEERVNLRKTGIICYECKRKQKAENYRLRNGNVEKR